MSNQYLANRLKYHAASRVGAKETDPLVNALNLDGHTVVDTKVWTSPPTDFPENTGANKTTTDTTIATDDLVTVFKAGGTSINYDNGKIWTNTKYPAVTLFENVDMTAVPGSNGSGVKYEAYEVLKTDGSRYMDWVSPMSAFDTTINKPIPGFTGKVEVLKSGKWTELQKCGDVNGVWALALGNWEFIYGAGIVTFNAANTPTQYNYTKVRWTGFLYTGLYLNDTVKELIHNTDNVFSGITLSNTTNIDKYITPGIVRILHGHILGTTPSIPNVTGFLQVMDVDHRDDTSSLKNEIRVRQILYPDSLADSSPYSRVGTVTSLDVNNIVWSTWTTMGGNLNRRVLDTSIVAPKYALPNTMYESYGSFILTLPSPTTYGVGTRIGLEQHKGVGKVVYGGYEQITSPDITVDDTVIGAIVYLFEIIEGESGNEWYLDTLQNNDGVFAAIQAQIAEHELANQANLYQQFTSGAIAAYTIPTDGYVKYTYIPTAGFTSGLLTISKDGTLVHTVSHADTPTDALCAVQAGSVIYYTCVPNSTAYPIHLEFSPDEHAMYLREDHLNSSWHNKSTLATTYPDGYFADSVHLEQASGTPASTIAVTLLQQYVDVQDDKLNNHIISNTNRVGVLESEMNSVENRATSLEARATTLESEMNSVEARATTLESEMNSVENRATSLEARATTNEAGIATNVGNISSLTTRMGAAESNIVTNTLDISLLALSNIYCTSSLSATQTLKYFNDCTPIFTYNTAGRYTITLPDPADVGGGRTCEVYKRGASQLTITYTTAIGTYTTYLGENEVAILHSDATNWIMTVVG